MYRNIGRNIGTQDKEYIGHIRGTEGYILEQARGDKIQYTIGWICCRYEYGYLVSINMKVN